MTLTYAIYDVFTDTPLQGNPLAVVFDADHLDDRAMQAIASEFNLSETVFITKAANERHTAALRIFTPAYELPFAGHPTIGAAIAMTERNGIGDVPSILMLEEGVGPVRCAVSGGSSARFGEFDVPKTPEALDLTTDSATIAAALGLGPHQIGFENHVPSHYSTGNPYVFVPVADLHTAGTVRLDPRAWIDLAPRRAGGSVACPYIYCRETRRHDRNFHARMMVPNNGTVYEDPATGSAAAAFAGVVAQFDQPVDGPTQLWIEQGIEMGRESSIRLEIEMAGGAIQAARVGGYAVRVAEGQLFI